MDTLDVVAGADEGESDDVHAQVQGEAQVALVLLGKGGDGNSNAGQVDALVVGDGATNDNAGGHGGLVNLDSFEADLAVINQQGIAGLDVSGQTLESGAADFLGAFNIFDGDFEGVAGFENLSAVLEGFEANLGALKVGENRDVVTKLFGLLADGCV